MAAAQAFSVTTPDKTLRLERPLGEFPVTVTNLGALADRADLEMEAVANGTAAADTAWFTWKGRPLPALESLAAGASVTFTIALELPQPAPANGTYGFRPLVYSAVRSHEETLTRGPDMTVEVALPLPPPPQVPWWRRYWWALVLALVAVVAVAAVVVVVVNRGTTYPAGGTALASDVHAPIGGSLDAAHKRVVLAEFGGRVAAVSTDSPGPSTTLGTGYQQLEDVAVLPSGELLVSERTGGLLRLPGTGAPRAGATLLAVGLAAPQQMALTADGRTLFVVEFDPPGRLLRYDVSGLTLPAPTVVASGLPQPIGVAVDANGTTAYVTEQGLQSLVRVPVAGGSPTVVASDLPAAFFVEWADSGRTRLLVAQRAPTNAVLQVTVATGRVETVVTAAPANPSSAVPIGGRNVAVLGDTQVRAFTLP